MWKRKVSVFICRKKKQYEIIITLARRGAQKHFVRPVQTGLGDGH
jgi:hypothetical protein